MPTLHILTEGFPQKSFDLPEGVTSVGRDDDNAIHISDASLSGNHGEFVVTSGVVVYRDLGSTNGSFHENDQQIIGDMTIAEGTIFRIGSVIVQLVNGHIDPDQSKRDTALIQVNPSGLTSDALESSQETFESPFRPKKTFGSKIFIVVVVVMFIAAIGILGYIYITA